MDNQKALQEEPAIIYFYSYTSPNKQTVLVETSNEISPLPESYTQLTKEQAADLKIHLLCPDERSKVLAISSGRFQIDDILDSEEKATIAAKIKERDERLKGWIPPAEVRAKAFGENSVYIDTSEKAQKINTILKKAIAQLPDNEAAEVAELFPAWDSTKTYEAQDRVYYNGQLYRCLSPHSAQETWTPEDAHSLWTKVLTSPTEILEWQQPDSTNPYNKGDRVYFNGEIYESELDGNVWSPATFGWKKIEQ